MSIFEADESCYRKVVVIRPDGFFDLGSIENSPDTLKTVELDCGKDCPSSPLKVIGMGGGFNDHLITWLGMRFNCQLIGHGS